MFKMEQYHIIKEKKMKRKSSPLSSTSSSSSSKCYVPLLSILCILYNTFSLSYAFTIQSITKSTTTTTNNHHMKVLSRTKQMMVLMDNYQGMELDNEDDEYNEFEEYKEDAAEYEYDDDDDDDEIQNNDQSSSSKEQKQQPIRRHRRSKKIPLLAIVGRPNVGKFSFSIFTKKTQIETLSLSLLSILFFPIFHDYLLIKKKLSTII